MIGREHEHQSIGSVIGKGKCRERNSWRGVARRWFQKDDGMNIRFFQRGGHIVSVDLVADDDRLPAFRHMRGPQEGVFEKAMAVAKIHERLRVGFTGKGPQARAAAAAEYDRNDVCHCYTHVSFS